MHNDSLEPTSTDYRQFFLPLFDVSHLPSTPSTPAAPPTARRARRSTELTLLVGLFVAGEVEVGGRGGGGRRKEGVPASVRRAASEGIVVFCRRGGSSINIANGLEREAKVVGGRDDCNRRGPKENEKGEEGTNEPGLYQSWDGRRLRTIRWSSEERESRRRCCPKPLVACSCGGRRTR
jgi:hypothetical protein